MLHWVWQILTLLQRLITLDTKVKLQHGRCHLKDMTHIFLPMWRKKLITPLFMFISMTMTKTDYTKSINHASVRKTISEPIKIKSLTKMQNLDPLQNSQTQDKLLLLEPSSHLSYHEINRMLMKKILYSPVI